MALLLLLFFVLYFRPWELHPSVITICPSIYTILQLMIAFINTLTALFIGTIVIILMRMEGAAFTGILPPKSHHHLLTQDGC
jgi:hypothetical protein